MEMNSFAGFTFRVIERIPTGSLPRKLNAENVTRTCQIEQRN